eukprot:6356803-Amphidinium_carterae.2
MSVELLHLVPTTSPIPFRATLGVVIHCSPHATSAETIAFVHLGTRCRSRATTCRSSSFFNITTLMRELQRLPFRRRLACLGACARTLAANDLCEMRCDFLCRAARDN